MRSKFGLPRITLEELASHSSEADCWTAYQGKVYNITEYLHYHPGGLKKLMLGAGKDCTDLFDKYHRWVNCEAFLGKYCVGILSERPPSITESGASEEHEEEEEGDGEAEGGESTAQGATVFEKAAEAAAKDKAALEEFLGADV